MKIFTRQLNYFMLLMAVYTLLFRMGLSHFMDHDSWIWLVAISLAYGIAIFFTAFFLGRADGQSNPFFDLGLRFHLSSYIIWGLVSFGWYYLGNPNQWEQPLQILYILIFWGAIVLCHVVAFLIMRRDTIRGIHKDELFG